MTMHRLVRQPSGDARWNRFTTLEEDQRLNVIKERTERMEARFSTLVRERQLIMKRAKKRMSRAEAKA